ncbi:MAG: PD-(D/E)XK nuclease family protein [Bacteroidales bacterium]|jgi:hypothetical protein|nr:PD-(D/E)XK nuclease family protein [Bacteroidales bacterium]
MNGISFLDSVAKTLYQTYGERITDCCLVFPGRRAGLFFQKELSRYLERDIWMPSHMGISQLAEKITGKKKTEHLFLLAELFKLYKGLTGKEESLQGFYSLGNIILHDFDQADKFLLNAEELFHNVRDLKRIGQDFSFLSPEQQQLLMSFWSSFQVQPDHLLNQHFISIWEKLPQLYQQFKTALKDKDLCYEGMIYRQMAESLDEEKSRVFINSFYRFVFIGFNALNSCEKKLFRFLRDNNKADFFWDYDSYYIEDSLQESGLFLRENLKDFPPPGGYRKDYSPLSAHREIRVVPVPSYVMQAKIVCQIIQDNNLPQDTRTAVVLGDENLLLPLLYGLGQQEKKNWEMNVTMGFPLRQTSLFGLFDSLLRYYDRPGTDKDFRPVSMHPYVQALGIASSIQKVPENTMELYAVLLQILDMIEESDTLPLSDVMLSPVTRETRKLLNKLHLSLSRSSTEIDKALFARLIRQHLSLATIPFSGEPLTGLQIMGFLETRCLDFENVVIVSAQENVLPKMFKDNSLIPRNVGKAFGLPSAEQHTAIQAYYFYRLLQRAKKVFLIWNCNPDGPGRGEVSRFVRQISFELPDSPVITTPLVYDYTLPKTRQVTVQKTETVKDLLQEFMDPARKKALSPTALETYIRCPLKFFYKHVLSLKEPEEITEESDSLHIGNIVHAVLENLYRPYIGKTVNKEGLLRMIEPGKSFRQLVSGVTEEYLQKRGREGIHIEPGRQVLFSEVAGLYAGRFIRYDAEQAPVHLLAVEKKFRCSYGKTVISGIIDRIDTRNGDLFLVDYKTGSEKNSFFRVEDLFDPQSSGRNGDAFQILCYVFLYRQAFTSAILPLPLLYYLNSPFSRKTTGNIRYKRASLNNRQTLAEIEEGFLSLISNLLEELFNFNIPFKQTDVVDNCLHCPFISICQREKYND